MAHSLQLVLIHGLTGVKMPSGDERSVRDFFAERFPLALIDDFVFPPMPLNGTFGSTDIKEQARLVHETLSKQEVLQDGSKSIDLPLVLMGLDLGGCLIKQILLMSIHEPRYNSTYGRVKGVMFFGTPPKSADTPSWESYLIRLMAACNFESSSPLPLLQNLPHSLNRVTEEFADISWNFDIVNIFEGGEQATNLYPTDLFRSFASLDSYDDRNVIVSFRSHFDLWKFNPEESHTVLVCKRIESMIKTQQHAAQYQFHKFMLSLSRVASQHCGLAMFTTIPRTGDSIASDTSYLEWTTKPEVGILHIVAPSESEDDMLAGQILKLSLQMQEQRPSIILRFFFNKHDSRAQRPMNLYASLCHQLLLARPTLFRHVQPLCIFLMEKSLWSNGSLRCLFGSLIKRLIGTTIYCVVNAIHASKGSLEAILSGISELTQLSEGSLKTIFISNSVHKPQDHWWVDSASRQIKSKQGRGMTIAIPALVRDNVARVVAKKPLWSELEDDIVDAVCWSSPPTHTVMYRLAKLQSTGTRSTKAALSHQIDQIKLLQSELQLEQYEQSEQSSPVTTYQESWIQSAFRWILYAARPLTSIELAIAVAFEELDRTPGQTLSDLVSRDVVGDIIMAAGPLIEVVDNYIVPAYGISRTSLDCQNPLKDSAESQHRILVTCLDYLRKESQKSSSVPRLELAEASDLESGLVSYACAYWPIHYMKSHPKLTSQSNIHVFEFLRDKSCLRYWAICYRDRAEGGPGQSDHHLNSPLQVVCRFGLIDLLRTEIICLNTYSRDELSKALDQAAMHGHVDSVKLLLNAGVVSSKALVHAAAGGNIGTMEVLVAEKSRLAERDEDGFTALHHASCRGHLAALDFLLSRDNLLLDATALDHSSALCLCAQTGQTASVETLIHHGADIQIRNSRGFDALLLAIRGGFIRIVQLLLHEGASLLFSTIDGNTPLHLAVEYGHLEILDILLVDWHHVDCMNKFKLTPLHLAIQKGFYHIVQKLLAARPRPEQPPKTCDQEGSEGKSLAPQAIFVNNDLPIPLQLASKLGNPKIVEALLCDKAGHTIEDCSGALFFAVGTGSVPIVQQLLEHSSKIRTDIRDSEKNTILHQAVEGGDINVLSMVLERVPSYVDVMNSAGHTPFHKTAEIGNLTMFKKLWEKGATIPPNAMSSRNPVGTRRRRIPDLLRRRVDYMEPDTSLIDLAVKGGHVAIVEYIFRNVPDQGSPLHSSSILSHDRILKTLLKSAQWKHDWNIPTEDGKSPLHLAVNIQHLPAVRLLKEAGAELDVRDDRGRTPLFVAAAENFPAAVNFLLGGGADNNAQDKRKRTPLHIASYSGHLKCVEELLENGHDVDVHMGDHNKWTPLHAAYKQPEITKLLLDHGADPKRLTLRQMTALSLACSQSMSNSRVAEVVRHYLNHGVDPDQQNHAGKSAVHYCASSGNATVMKILIEQGAQLDLTDKNSNSPLHLAASRIDGIEIANILIDNDVDVFRKSKTYGTCLMAAASGGLPKIGERLIQKGADVNEVCRIEQYRTALQAAAYHGRIEMIEWLIENRAEVKNDGDAICMAIVAGSGSAAPIVAKLLAAGADLNSITCKEVSVLGLAVDRGLAEVVKVLLENSRAKDRSNTASGECHTKLFTNDKYGRSLLSRTIVAKKDRGQSVFDVLVEHQDVDINGRDNSGRTPLMLAVLSRAEIFVKKLLSKRPNIDARDSEGKTALIHACILDEKQSVQKLLEAGASTLVLDFRERGPLYWACRRSSMEVFERVSEALKTESGEEYASHCWHALSAAVASNRLSFLEKLLKTSEPLSGERANDGWTPVYTAQRYELRQLEERLRRAPVVANTAVEHSPKLPSAWCNTDKTVSLIVDSTSQWITVGDGPLTPGDHGQSLAMGTVRADHPMIPIGAFSIYYFEVEIETNKKPNWGIGFCEEDANLNLMVGWSKNSWGYHGDDGDLYTGGSRYHFGDKYDTGNIIGCGIDFEHHSAFFTKDGRIIGKAFDGIRGKLYPAISVDQSMTGAQISVKFWNNDSYDFSLKKTDLNDPATRMNPRNWREDDSSSAMSEESNISI